MPHRCAHQFGLDKDIPAMIYPSSTISADLEGFARCWATFLRLGTESRFLLPKTARVATFTAFYRRWFHDLVRQCQSYSPPSLVPLVCPARGDPAGARSVPELRRAPDLQGFDSLLLTQGLLLEIAQPLSTLPLCRIQRKLVMHMLNHLPWETHTNDVPSGNSAHIDQELPLPSTDVNKFCTEPLLRVL